MQGRAVLTKWMIWACDVQGRPGVCKEIIEFFKVLFYFAWVSIRWTWVGRAGKRTYISAHAYFSWGVCFGYFWMDVSFIY